MHAHTRVRAPTHIPSTVAESTVSSWRMAVLPYSGFRWRSSQSCTHPFYIERCGPISQGCKTHATLRELPTKGLLDENNRLGNKEKMALAKKIPNVPLNHSDNHHLIVLQVPLSGQFNKSAFPAVYQEGFTLSNTVFLSKWSSLIVNITGTIEIKLYC